MYMKMLKRKGELCIVGLPAVAEAPVLKTTDLVFSAPDRFLKGWQIGGLPETQEMLDYSVIVLDKLTSAWYITHYANEKTKTTNRKQRPIPAGMRTCCYPQKGLCGVQVRTDKIRSRHEMSCS